MRKKRLFSLLLAIILIFSVFSFSATAAQVTTINDFGSGTNLSWSQYDILRTGKISVAKINNIWYYQFRKDGNTVRVKASAFSSSVSNNYKNINSTLTKGVMSTSGIAFVTNYVYKARTSIKTSNVVWTPKKTMKATPVKMKSYTTYLAYLTLTSSRVGTEVDLQCLKNGQVQFVYNDKVKVQYASDGTGYRSPRTVAEYKAALARNTSNSVSTKLLPVFSVNVTKPGDNCVCLNSVMYRGKGKTDTKTDVTQFIDVAITTAKIVKDFSKALSLQSLYSLYKQGVKMKSSSSEYVSNKKTYLSYTKNNKTYSCLKAEFDSPVKLNAFNDYFRAEIRLNKALSTSGTKTQIAVGFNMNFAN